jgi:hypothetical protein
MAAPPAIPPMESTDSFNPDLNSSSSPTRDGDLTSPIEDTTPASPEQRTAPHDAQTQQRVHDILHSDVGVATLLNRLKASIASARVSDAQSTPLHLDTLTRSGRTSAASSSAEELSRKSTPAASRS